MPLLIFYYYSSLLSLCFTIKASLCCTPQSPTYQSSRAAASAYSSPHSLANANSRHSSRTFSNQFLNGVPQQNDNNYYDAQQQPWGRNNEGANLWTNWLNNNDNGNDNANDDGENANGRNEDDPEELAVPDNLTGANILDEGGGDGGTTAVPQLPPLSNEKRPIAHANGEADNDGQNNDLLLLQSATTGRPLPSLHILPINIEEKDEEEKGKAHQMNGTTTFKDEVPLAKIVQSPFGAQDDAKALFVPLDCPQNGPHNYGDLLNCLEVEVKPFDGYSFVEKQLPAPNPQQICHFDEDAEEKCSFYSTEDGSLQFNLGRFHADVQNYGKYAEAFAQMTKRPNGDIPKGHFLAVIEPEGKDPRNAAILKVDIACQEGDGQLSFSYWSTFEQFLLKVCTRMGTERHCTTSILYTPDSSRAEIQVINPSGKGGGRFSVEIIASGFFEAAILILDNLKYEAKECAGEIGENGGGGRAQKSGAEKIAEAKIFTPKAKIAIPFRMEEKEWNEDLAPIGAGNAIKYEKIEVRPSAIKMENDELEEEADGEEDGVKYWPSRAYPMGKKVAMEKDAKLRREMVKLMGGGGRDGGKKTKKEEKKGDGRKGKKIADGMVKVPGIKIMPLNSTQRRLGPLGEDSKGEEGKKKEEKKIEEKQRKEIYDRIGALRKLRRLRLANVPKRKTALSACELLECKFTNGFCHYSQVENGGKFRLGKWKIAMPRPPNINIKSSRSQQFSMPNATHSNQTSLLKFFGYAYIGSDNHYRWAEDKHAADKFMTGRFGRTIYILQSPEFTLLPSNNTTTNHSNGGAQLQFDIYKRTNSIALQICLNSIMNCVYAAPPVEEEENGRWQREERVDLPTDTKRFFIIATQWKGSSWLAIDNIHLKIDAKNCNTSAEEE